MSKLYFIGLDPGSGVKSPTGVAILDVDTFEIVECNEIWPESKRNHEKFYEIASEVRALCKPYIKKSVVASEYFVMRAKSGQTLQRLIGALHAALHECISIIEPSNVVVKQVVGGDGAAGKKAVGEGLLSYFKNKNQNSHDYIKALVKNENWDALDAIAIAVTAYLTSTDTKGGTSGRQGH